MVSGSPFTCTLTWPHYSLSTSLRLSQQDVQVHLECSLPHLRMSHSPSADFTSFFPGISIKTNWLVPRYYFVFMHLLGHKMEGLLSGKITLEDKKLGGWKHKVASWIRADKPRFGLRDILITQGSLFSLTYYRPPILPQAPASKAQLMDTLTIVRQLFNLDNGG